MFLFQILFLAMMFPAVYLFWLSLEGIEVVVYSVLVVVVMLYSRGMMVGIPVYSSLLQLSQFSTPPPGSKLAGLGLQ